MKYQKYFETYTPEEDKKSQRKTMILGSILGLVMAGVVFAIILFLSQ